MACHATLRGIFSLKEPTVSLTHAHIRGENTTKECAVHPLDAGILESAAEPSLGEYARLATVQEQLPK